MNNEPIKKPRKLTYKQKEFAKRYAATLNGTQSALEVYDTKDPATGNAIATENLQKPLVKEEIDTLLERNGLSLQRLTAKHAQLVDAPIQKAVSLNEITRLLEIGYKLHNAFPASKSLIGHINLNKQYQDAPMSDLIKELKEIRKQNDRLIKE